MSAELQPSRACLALVKAFEGYRPAAASLPDGGWTVGYGHTASARAGARVSEADAEALLTYDLGRVALAVRAQVFTPLSQNQFDALVAFAFNVGGQAFSRSTVLKRLNQGDHLGAAHALERWHQAQWQGEAQVIDALVRRRAAEKALFLTPTGGFPHAPSSVLRPLFDAEGGDPVDARAGRAVEVPSPLQGPLSPPSPAPDAEPDALERPATLIAADALSARLRDIAVDPFSTPAPAETAAEAVAVDDHDPEPGPFPASDPADVAGPSRETPPPAPPHAPSLEPEAPPFPEEAVAPFPHAVVRPPAPVEAAADFPAFAPSLPPAAARAFPEEALPARGPAPMIRLSWVIGLVGLLLFGAAIASMVATRATAVNLAAGLLGVFALAYAGAELILPWLARRGPKGAADRAPDHAPDRD